MQQPSLLQPQPPATIAAKQIAKTRYIDAFYTADEWLNVLRSIVEDDTENDHVRRILGWSAFILVVVAVIASLIASSPIPLLLFGGLSVLAIILYIILKRRDLHNNLRLCVVPLIRILREDMEPGAKIALRVDLRGKLLNEKQVHQNEYKPHGGSYPRVVETFYVDPWMTGSAALADGSVLEWQIVDRVRQRRMTKRNPRGKIKTKTKYKIKTAINVWVRLRQDHYAVESGAIPALGDGFRLKPGQKRTVIRGRRMVESRDINAVLEISHILDLIGGAYRQARPVPDKGEQV